jgi:glyoxylase-like metal-dependent hydrolase (beta-lactamase superfamily II)
LLGSGGWIPTPQRLACSAFVRRGDRALIIDAGTRLQRLVGNPHLLDGVWEVDPLLTHFHLDHVVGFAYLSEVDLPGPPRGFAPGQAPRLGSHHPTRGGEITWSSRTSTS